MIPKPGEHYGYFYHFTAKRFVNSIKKTGLSRGMIPVSINPPVLLPNYQWITISDDFNQAWAKGAGNLPYQRNEVRFNVRIPTEHRDKLHKFLDCRHLSPKLFEILISQGDPQNWYVYNGFIPGGWLSGKTLNTPTPKKEAL